jgi:hypothetical protein
MGDSSVPESRTTALLGFRPPRHRTPAPARSPRSPAWLVLAVLAGCGGPVDKLPRQAVWGSVTLDGKPLERGTIAFQPVSELPTAAAVAINGGQYSMARAEGLVPGSYRVLISSTPTAVGQVDPKTSRPPPPGQASPPPKESLPEKYNASTTLTAEVKEGTTNTFDFPLQSAPK